ncbi:MAG: hypothetical protein J6J74_07340 [Elusimicrobiaceae bacterium]|nr:hypothetical protein [Elusimicrobiaceae bacterium]
MTVEEKIRILKSKRANILGKAQKQTRKLEREFKNEMGSKRPLMEQVKSFGGRYYATVGPLLKQAKEYQRAIELLK